MRRRWLYAPDTSRQAQGAESWQIATLRLTLQASPRNKFNFHWDEQMPCNGSTYTKDADGCRQQPVADAFVGSLGLGGLSGTTSPEIASYLHSYQRVRQLTWTSPLTNRLLLEGGVGSLARAMGTDGHAGESDANRWCACRSSARAAAPPTAALRT